jgi:hypothetical protein
LLKRKEFTDGLPSLQVPYNDSGSEELEEHPLNVTNATAKRKPRPRFLRIALGYFDLKKSLQERRLLRRH